MGHLLEDYDQILATVQLYVDGFGHNDGVTLFQEAIHPGAWIYFIDQEGLVHERPLDDAIFTEWANRRITVQMRVLNINQLGDAANATIAFGSDYFDFLNLMRINGVWKITNKTASHQTR